MTAEEFSKQFAELKEAYIAENAKFKIGDKVITPAGIEGKVRNIHFGLNNNEPMIYYNIINAENEQEFYDSYELKPIPKYRPFRNAEELDKAIAEHGIILKNIDDGTRCVIIWYNEFKISVNDTERYYETALGRYTFLDGTPFGVLENE